MSYSNFLQNSAKMKFQAANAKPEKPKWGDQIAVDKQLLDLQKEATQPDKAIDKRMYEELNKSWENGRPGGSGDAFISGLRGGLEKRSLLDDKERYKKIMDTTEKMKSMVAFQNDTLAKKEKEHYAKEYIKPRIMAYLDQANKMDPNARKVYLQHALDEYNDTAGTSYRVLDAFGSEPWKITVSDGEGSEVLDLMDFAKTSEEKKYELYMNSNEMRMAEQAAIQEHNMSIQKNQSYIDANNARSAKYNGSNSLSGQLMIDAPDGSRIDVSEYPELSTTRQKNMYSQTFTGMSKALRELEDTYKEVEELESMSKNNLFQPFGSQVGSLPNKIKDFTAKNPNADGEVSKEVILRNKIESRFQQLQPVLERFLKGSAPDAQLLKRMHEKGVYPEPTQSMPVIKEKLQMLIKTIKEDRDIAGASLKSGRQIPFFPEAIGRQEKSQVQSEVNKDSLLIRRQQLLERKNQLMQGQTR